MTVVTSGCSRTPCDDSQLTVSASYLLGQVHAGKRVTISFIPLLVYGSCLTDLVDGNSTITPGTGSKLMITDIRFGLCPDRSSVSDEIYGIRVYINTDSDRTLLARRDFPFYADITFVR